MPRGKSDFTKRPETDLLGEAAVLMMQCFCRSSDRGNAIPQGPAPAACLPTLRRSLLRLR